MNDALVITSNKIQVEFVRTWGPRRLSQPVSVMRLATSKEDAGEAESKPILRNSSRYAKETTDLLMTLILIQENVPRPKVKTLLQASTQARAADS